MKKFKLIVKNHRFFTSSSNTDLKYLTKIKGVDKNRLITNNNPTIDNMDYNSKMLSAWVFSNRQNLRKYHHDMKPPNFTKYMRDEAKCVPEAEDGADKRRLLTYSMSLFTGLSFAYGAKTIINQLVASMSASAEVLALAKVEIRLDDIPEGKSITFKWRGKPLFIRHRTPAQIEATRAVDVKSLRHPQKDEDRCQYPEWLIVIGVCTHLGCVPIADAGDFPGGYYCPCHGSHFDGAGRVRKGPAPLNLEIPHYEISDGIVIVG